MVEPDVLLQHNALALYKVYLKGYAFPEWTIRAKMEDSQKNKNRYAESVTVYFDRNHDQEVIQKLLEQREPVNIEMERHYSQPEMQNAFGWKTGYYREYYTKNETLAPNFGVFCTTRVKIPDDLDEYGDLADTYLDNVNVFNAIGYAFDAHTQPDYEYFIYKGNHGELPERYRELFRRVYQCAADHKMNKVVMALVGANNFAKLYLDNNGGYGATDGPDHFQRSVWAPALLAVMQEFPDIETVMMGAEKAKAFRLPGTDLEKMADTGDFPKNAANMSEQERDKTLFVNAWDPWSIVGNGNVEDPSLDGWMGQVSMMALLCWPLTNNLINYKRVDVSRSGSRSSSIKRNNLTTMGDKLRTVIPDIRKLRDKVIANPGPAQPDQPAATVELKPARNKYQHILQLIQTKNG